MWKAEADTEWTLSASPTTAVGQKALLHGKYRTKEWFLFFRLAFSFGHDHIGDGLRPSLPNYVHIGMLNCQCQPKTAVPDNMVQFMESDEAKKFGVIIVAFGTLIGPPQVSCNQFNDFFGMT